MYENEGPKGFLNGLLAIIFLSLLVYVFSLISSGCQQGLSSLIGEAPYCSQCETEDAYMEGLCSWCLQDKYDYDVWCCVCGEEFILHTEHYFKGYCNSCAKIDWAEYFCSQCGSYTDNPNSLVNNKCAKCNQ